MKVPQRLEPLVEQGVIEEVLRPLLSGKEADVWLVTAGGELRVAKVYKEATNRSFKNRSDYTEGRKVRNSRTQRAMQKRSKFGRDMVEEAWRTAEVDAIQQLDAAGVRVPHPYDFIEGVLVMELICGEDGGPAPRLADMRMDRDEAIDLFNMLLQEVVKMLCAGVVHGDLSDFNVLLGTEGAVIIDFPQWTDPGSNNNARELLLRDVKNLQGFLARWAPDLKQKAYAAEMWSLYEAGTLLPTTKLTGKKPKDKPKADTMSLLEEIEAIEREVRARRERLGLPPPGPARKPKPEARPARPQGARDSDAGGKKGRGKRKRGNGDNAQGRDDQRGGRSDRGGRNDRGSRNDRGGRNDRSNERRTDNRGGRGDSPHNRRDDRGSNHRGGRDRTPQESVPRAASLDDFDLDDLLIIED